MLEFIGLITVVGLFVGAILVIVYNVIEYFNFRERMKRDVSNLGDRVTELEDELKN